MSTTEMVHLVFRPDEKDCKAYLLLHFQVISRAYLFFSERFFQSSHLPLTVEQADYFQKPHWAIVVMAGHLDHCNPTIHV